MDHKVVSRDEWLRARTALLKKEKALTRRSDDLARQRLELPWVRIEEDYRFETEQGGASLEDLFRGRSQLLVYHFMFGPDGLWGMYLWLDRASQRTHRDGGLVASPRRVRHRAQRAQLA